jgi:hypothetical protein
LGVNLKRLLGFIITCFEALPNHLNVQLISCDHDVITGIGQVFGDLFGTIWDWLKETAKDIDGRTDAIVVFKIIRF